VRDGRPLPPFRFLSRCGSVVVDTGGMEAKALRAEEVWAQRVIGRALDLDVVQHDDNSEDGMYDLRVGPRENPVIAIEVVSAVDNVFTATWNSGPAKGPKQWPLISDWIVQLERQANNKQIEAHLPATLAALESANFDGGLPVDHILRRHNRPIWEVLNGLGISFVCSRRPGRGEVSFTMSGRGGAIDSHGANVPRWIGEWLRDARRDDVLKKLAATTALERHVFIPVSLQGAGWPIESYLTTWLGQRELPSDPPDLPNPVTAVWLVSTMAERGVRWDGRRWSWFMARGSGIDDE
jgi:hypothetical protein